jgi:Icc-related predicted phosphoesterase
MKIIALSDIHGDLIKVPKCDVVCICGDILPLNIQRDLVRSWTWLICEFTPWANSLKCDHVVFVAGNHDFIFEQCHQVGSDIKNMWKDYPKIHYLIDESVEINGKKFYGTPWCPSLHNWAFYKSSEELTDVFSKIEDCDVLLTHCPPKTGLTGTVLETNYNYMRDFGCQELTDAISNKKISWILSGHIHSGDHNIFKFDNGIQYINIVNVSIKDESYRINYKPFKFEI